MLKKKQKSVYIGIIIWYMECGKEKFRENRAEYGF